MVKNPPANAGDPGFNPWVGKITWRRAWQPTPAFFPREFHGQRSLAGYSPWGHRESDMTKRSTLLSHYPPASHPSFHSSPVLNTLLCFLPYLPPQPCQVRAIAVLTLTLLQRWKWVGHSALDYHVPRLPARVTPLPHLYTPWGEEHVGTGMTKKTLAKKSAAQEFM